MAEPENTQAEPAEKNPGSEPAVTENADLGAGVGPGEDYDQVEQEQQPAEETPPPPDPTKNMSPREAMEFWRNKANHFESEYKVERTKRQSYDKQYGGLNGLTQQRQQQERAIDRYTDLQIPQHVNDLNTYSNYLLAEAERRFEAKATEKTLNERLETSEIAAREAHDGSDGLPGYDELVDDYVTPFLKENPDAIRLIRYMKNPGESAYTLGFILKYNKNFASIMSAKTRDELMKNINDTAKQAANVRGKNNGRTPSGRLTKAEIEAMSPEDFEKELERFRSGA